jgi:hypothetical protein
MRLLEVVPLAVALCGCAASKQEVVSRLGDQYIGKNVDALVSQFGPPASTFRMNSGETAYLWQLAAETDIDISSDKYGSNGSAKTYYCKVKVIASPAGIVTKPTTEDASGTGGLLGLAGVDVYGSVCANHLEMPRQT